MSAGHTKGEWWADHRGDVIAMPSQVRVAVAHGETPEERRANALLIASAPGLLEAVRLAANQASQLAAWCDSAEEAEKYRADEQAYRALIAKASATP